MIELFNCHLKPFRIYLSKSFDINLKKIFCKNFKILLTEINDAKITLIIMLVH